MRIPPSLGPTAALVALAALLALLPHALVSTGWTPHWAAGLLWTLGALGAGAWVGWAFRQAFLYPRRHRRAERLWAQGAPAEKVLDLLAPLGLATGELGYRARLLRARALLALEGREAAAWLEGQAAHLKRQPFWLRPPLRAFLAAPAPAGDPARWLARGRRLQRLAPDMPRLNHALALRLLADPAPERWREGWEQLLEALPSAGDDPQLLDALLLVLLDRLRLVREAQGEQLGRQLREPELRSALERVLNLLRQRNGDARLPWHRGAAARWLLEEGRSADAADLARGLEPGLRPAELWTALAVALRELGDLEGAWREAEQGLARHPRAFGLWLARFDLAMDLGRSEAAEEALRRAWPEEGPFPEDEEDAWEWRLRAADYAYSIQGDAQAAWDRLAPIPQAWRMRRDAALDLELRRALGRTAEVYAEAQLLLKERPRDPDLLLIQADCLADLEEWDALSPFLEQLPQDLKGRAEFLHLRGICRCHQGDLVGSREDLEAAAHQEQQDLRYVLDAGHGCAELGEWERSERHWRQALQLDERNEEAFIQLAESRRELLDLEGARRLLRECLLHHPESAGALELLAELEAQ